MYNILNKANKLQAGEKLCMPCVKVRQDLSCKTLISDLPVRGRSANLFKCVHFVSCLLISAAFKNANQSLCNNENGLFS
jgi:hypothetical protein